MSRKIAVGVDLGGTLVRVGLLAAEGELLRQDQAGIAGLGPELGLPIIEDLIEKLLTEQGSGPIAGIGVGSTGPIDAAAGRIHNPYTLHGWSDVPIVDRLRQRFGVPVALENDADAAALGELWQGAGRGAKRLYAVTVGTGVGTSFIQDGVLHRGKDGVHPEGGHQLIDPNGPECYCGYRGCWESLVAGPAIARRARAAGGATEPGKEAEADERFEARHLAEAARRGDSFAIAVLRDVARDLARGIVNIILLFVPDVLVLGGGVMESADLLLPELRAALKTQHPMVPLDAVSIVPAQLGERAGLYGSAYVILKEEA